MVEIGAGDAELVGHLALIEPALAAQPLEPSAEEELALKHRPVNLSNYLQEHKSLSDIAALFSEAFTKAIGFPLPREDRGTRDERFQSGGRGARGAVRGKRPAIRRRGRAEAARPDPHRAYPRPPRRAQAVGIAAPARARPRALCSQRPPGDARGPLRPP